MMKPLICASVIAFACAFSAQAGELNAPRHAVVHYDDINIHEAAGARILLARIETTAEHVCGPAPDIRELNAWGRFRTCMKTAQDNAVASLPFNLMAQLSSQNEAVATR